MTAIFTTIEQQECIGENRKSKENPRKRRKALNNQEETVGSEILSN